MTVADLCVICNPKSGQGRGRRLQQRLQRLLGTQAEFWPTRGPRHAEELAYQASQAGFAVVGAAGGDGTVHEVVNGLVRAGRPEVVLAVFPVGSANDYAYSLGLDSRCWQRWLQGDSAIQERAVDVGVVQSADGRRRYFMNGLGLGFNAAVTLERDRIPWLRGVPLYSLSLLAALCYRFGQPIMKVSFCPENGQDENPVVRQRPTLALTVAVGQREGNFLLTPRALLDDGLFDYLHAGALKRWELLRYFPGLLTGDLPTDHPELWTGRCRKVAVESEAPLAVHIDGEFFCRPEDKVHSLDIRILPGALRVRGRVVPVTPRQKSPTS